MQKMFSRVAQRCVGDGLYHHRCSQLQLVNSLSTFSRLGNVRNSVSNSVQNTNSAESTDDFERRMFGGNSSEDSSSFFRKLDRIEKSHTGFGMDPTTNFRLGPNAEDGDSLTTLSDGLDNKLRDAAAQDDSWLDEIPDDYCYRPDSNLRDGMTYTPQDLNIRKPAVWRPAKQNEFEVTTEEALKKADFRNVRFLANFLTDAGIIIKRSKTKISAKAQRRVAREIKTARAFGLLPFTTMGTKAFVFGRTMEDLDEDFMVENYENPNDTDVQDSI